MIERLVTELFDALEADAVSRDEWDAAVAMICPKCGSALELIGGGERGETNCWLCTNPDCLWDSESAGRDATS